METMQYIKLLESSASRIWQHINENKDFAVISAYCKKYPESENYYRNIRMSFDIHIMGDMTRSKHIKLSLLFNHDYGRQEKDVSIFIPNISLHDAIRLSVIYEQETFLFKNKKGFVLMKPDGNVVTNFTKKNLLCYNADLFKKAYMQFIKSRYKNALQTFTFIALQEEVLSDGFQFLLPRLGHEEPKWVTII